MFTLALRMAGSHLRQRLFSRIFVIISVASILLINGMVYTLFHSLSASIAEVKASQFMTAYLDSSVAASKEVEVLSAVKKLPGVMTAQLISKEAFLENFAKYFPQLSSELETIDTDTIPRYLKIKVATEAESSTLHKLQKLKGVELVELNKNKYTGLIEALLTLRKVSIGLIGGLSLAILCILLNHFKLNSDFQIQVRQTLSYLGARNGFVFLPFAIEGFLEGALGGGLAAAALLASGNAVEAQINTMFTAIGYHAYHFQLTNVAIGLALLGPLAGMLGSVWAAVRIK